MNIQDHIRVELEYPHHSPVKHIIVGLLDVRSADDLKIEYDYDRDGWVIYQASIFEWDGDDTEMDNGWKEAAFCPAWQFEPPNTAGTG
jgi:hypothetical protein